MTRGCKTCGRVVRGSTTQEKLDSHGPGCSVPSLILATILAHGGTITYTGAVAALERIAPSTAAVTV